jgi:hypothetical protein
MLSFNCEINDLSDEFERFEIFKWIVSVVEPKIASQ